LRLPLSFNNFRPAAGLRGMLGCGALACILLVGAGCDMNPIGDPTELTGRPNARRVLAIQILDKIDPGVEEPNVEYANAQPPRADDLRAPVGDYTISRNDILTVSVSDLQGPGVETTKQMRVSESGNISLAYIGQIRAEGLTEIELEREIVEAYRRANLIQSATVSVVVFEARGRAFTISGAVARPGVFAIVESDYRVTDALAAAGDVNTPLTKELYILRRLDERPRPAAEPGPGQGQPGGTGQQPPVQGNDDLAPRSDSGAGLNADDAQAVANRVPRQAGSRRERILHLMQARPAQEDSDDRIINLDGQEVPARRTTTGQQPTTRPSGAGAATQRGAAGRTAAQTPGRAGQTRAGQAGQGTGQSGTFEFGDLGPPPDVRVIRISLDDLRRGDLSQNVVVRARDTIFVPTPEFGTYYMGGHVARPGAYTLSGQRVTLKQAIIAASMLDQLAIPQRTDVIRRLGAEKEVWVRVDLAKVFAGQQPDLFIKPDDQVLVGTNALAPYLASLRNAFRFTYGAGFLYDRNFAYPEEAFGSQ